MSELHGTSSETSEPAADTQTAATADHEPTRDNGSGQYLDDAAIEASLDEADLPTRAESRAATWGPDASDDGDTAQDGPDAGRDGGMDANTAGPDRLPAQHDVVSASSGPDPLTVTTDGNLQGQQELSVPVDDGHEMSVTVVKAEPGDRTLGDTTPTGIGLKPTGDQLLHIENDDPARSRLDRLLEKAVEGADDLHDGIGNTGEAVFDFRNPPGNVTGHAFESHAGHEHPAAPDPQGVNDMIGGAALIAVAIVASARHWMSNRRKVDSR